MAKLAYTAHEYVSHVPVWNFADEVRLETNSVCWIVLTPIASFPDVVPEHPGDHSIEPRVHARRWAFRHEIISPLHCIVSDETFGSIRHFFFFDFDGAVSPSLLYPSAQNLKEAKWDFQQSIIAFAHKKLISGTQWKQDATFLPSFSQLNVPSEAKLLRLARMRSVASYCKAQLWISQVFERYYLLAIIGSQWLWLFDNGLVQFLKIRRIQIGFSRVTNLLVHLIQLFCCFYEFGGSYSRQLFCVLSDILQDIALFTSYFPSIRVGQLGIMQKAALARTFGHTGIIGIYGCDIECVGMKPIRTGMITDTMSVVEYSVGTQHSSGILW